MGIKALVAAIGLSRLFGALSSVLISATLLFSLQLALAQFSQQGPKLVGAGVVGSAEQGFSVAVSADGNTAIVGGFQDNSNAGAAWVYIRNGGVWGQHGGKLVGAGAVGGAEQGASVRLSADGNTAIVGGPGDNSGAGAAWVYIRNGGVWSQQGGKLVGTGAAGNARQGVSVALSTDGNTAIVGGSNESPGAAWVYIRNGGVWSQQGGKLVGTGAVGPAQQGISVALSDDGNTAIVGGRTDDSNAGAAWVYTRGLGVWGQQGGKLVANDAVGKAFQGYSVSLSADGNTAAVGGPFDSTNIGAGWIYVRSGGIWTQQGGKLVGMSAVGQSFQGSSIALSGAGNTALMGGPLDDTNVGAAWVFTRNGGVWSQQGGKLVGTGAVGGAEQGIIALSADGNTAIVGGIGDNGNVGAAWVFVQPVLQVSPATNIAASGTQGEAFAPASFQYQLASTIGSVNYQITGIPTWLNANIASGTASTTPVIVTFSLINPGSRSPGTYTATITFTNTSNGQGNTTRTATLTVNAGTKDACKDGGWKNYISFPGPFKNQGQCVSYFAGKK